MKVIAHIQSPFPEKFGIPRQAGIVNTPAHIIFEPEYRVAEAVRGLEGFEYIWLLWAFSHTHPNAHQGWSPTVRPPRLGGNERVGVFATRSPNRPNPIGLSSVKLTAVELTTEQGPMLHIEGADLMDGTPIYDIKPYLPYTDSHPDARSGFATQPADSLLEVCCRDELMAKLPMDKRASLVDILAHDPRPRYHDDPERVYGMAYGGYNIRFRISKGCVEVMEVTE